MRRIGFVTECGPDSFNAASATRPTIVRSLVSHWPAVGLWSPEHFAAAHGRVTLRLNRNDPADGTFLDQTLKSADWEMTLAEYAARIRTMDPRWSLREDLNVLYADTRLRQDVDSLRPLLGGWSGERLKYLAFWFSPAYQVTGLHADLVDVYLAQVYGRKRVYLVDPRYGPCLYAEGYVKFNGARVTACSMDEVTILREQVEWSALDFFAPDYMKFPRSMDAEYLEGELCPGDVLYVPCGWWHAMQSATVSMSISVERDQTPRR